MAMRWVLGLGLVFACVGCARDNLLGGSIGESLDLGFDAVEVVRIDDFFVIEYRNHAGEGVNKVCKVIVDTSDLQPADGTVIDGALFLAKVTLERATFKGDQFPQVRSGSLYFDQWAEEPGESLVGHFDALFVDGKSINGNFDGRLADH